MVGSEEREYSVGSVVPVFCDVEDCVESELDRLVLMSLVVFAVSDRLGMGMENEDRPLLEFDMVVVAPGRALIVTLSSPSLSLSLAPAPAPNSSPIDLVRFFMYCNDSSLGLLDLSNADSVPEEYIDEWVVAEESRRDCIAEGRREDRRLSLLLRKLIASSTSSSRSSNTGVARFEGEEGTEGEKLFGGSGLENPELRRLDLRGR